MSRELRRTEHTQDSRSYVSGIQICDLHTGRPLFRALEALLGLFKPQRYCPRSFGHLRRSYLPGASSASKDSPREGTRGYASAPKTFVAGSREAFLIRLPNLSRDSRRARVARVESTRPLGPDEINNSTAAGYASRGDDFVALNERRA